MTLECVCVWLKLQIIFSICKVRRSAVNVIVIVVRILFEILVGFVGR